MLRRLLNGLVDIVYPRICLACKKRLTPQSVANLICMQCWGKIKRNLPPFCYHCGRHIDPKINLKNICNSCIKRPLHFDRAFSPCVYEGVIKELIHQFKYKNKDYLGLILSKLMIEFIREYNLPMEYMDLIISLPLHKARLREREFNQAQVLGNYIAKEFNKTLLNNCLIRRRLTKTQTELEEGERFLNVQDSFSLNTEESLKGKNILLVDDVLTTGATASEAARVLKEAETNIVFVLTLAS